MKKWYSLIEVLISLWIVSTLWATVYMSASQSIDKAYEAKAKQTNQVASYQNLLSNIPE